MSVCIQCGGEFSCGMVDVADGTPEPCWCTNMPVLPGSAIDGLGNNSDNAQCLCPACLAARCNAVAPDR